MTLGQLGFISIETGNHGIEHGARVEPFQIEQMAGPLGQHGKERQLRPPVSFAECVDDVQLIQRGSEQPSLRTRSQEDP